MSVTLIYEFTALDGKADELAPLVVAGRDFGRSVDGCEAFDVFRSEDNAHQFVMIETWATPEAQARHFEANVVASGVLDRVAALVTEPIQPNRFIPL